jgi:hypothetical protein
MSAPRWASVDDDTAALLSLVATDQLHPRPGEEWDRFVAGLRATADESGRIDPNWLRENLRGEIAPRRIGAFTQRAKAEGLIEWRGEWVTSTDREGKNSGRPCRIYHLASP